MLTENMTALFVFALWCAAFALGYILRGLYAGAFKGWANETANRKQHRARSKRVRAVKS